ncbi:hypothetical protein AVEN_151875-1, partial [Araneus ventricosus]
MCQHKLWSYLDYEAGYRFVYTHLIRFEMYNTVKSPISGDQPIHHTTDQSMQTIVLLTLSQYYEDGFCCEIDAAYPRKGSCA